MRGQTSVQSNVSYNLQQPNLLGSKWGETVRLSFQPRHAGEAASLLASDNWIPDAYRVAILGRGLRSNTKQGEKNKQQEKGKRRGEVKFTGRYRCWLFLIMSQSLLLLYRRVMSGPRGGSRIDVIVNGNAVFESSFVALVAVLRTVCLVGWVYARASGGKDLLIRQKIVCSPKHVCGHQISLALFEVTRLP